MAALLAKSQRRPQPAQTGVDAAHDPDTGALLVDPVLCSDGKLHDRLSTRALSYLDRSMTLGKSVQVLGEDLVVRSMVHERYPQAGRMFQSRNAVQNQLPLPARPEISRPQRATGPLSEEEIAFRSYQLRARRGGLLNVFQQPFLLRSERQPLSLSQRAFSHARILSPAASRALVRHLTQHGVLQSAERRERYFGDAARIQGALDTFVHRGSPLTAEQKGHVTRQLRYFERLYGDAWEISADLRTSEALHDASFHACFYGYQPLYRHERFRAAYTFAATFRQEAWQRMETLARFSPPQRTPHEDASAPLDLTRSHSAPNLRSAGPLHGVDEDLLSCPVSLEPMPMPVLCSDGHSYDRMTLLSGDLTVSPLTREPMRAIGRHYPKERWYSAENAVSADYLRKSWSALSEVGKKRVKRGCLADQVLLYQRRPRRSGEGANPDRLSVNIFHTFGVVKTRRDSEWICSKLSESAVLFPGASDWPSRNSLDLFRRVLPTATDAQIREALAPAALSERQLRLTCEIVGIVRRETLRRTALVGRAQHLADELQRLPAHAQRYRVAEQLLDKVSRALHKLPSGGADGLETLLY